MSSELDQAYEIIAKVAQEYSHSATIQTILAEIVDEMRKINAW